MNRGVDSFDIYLPDIFDLHSASELTECAATDEDLTRRRDRDQAGRHIHLISDDCVIPV